MNLSLLILIICCLIFLSLGLFMHIYQNKLISNMDVPIITEYIDCTTQELKELEEII